MQAWRRAIAAVAASRLRAHHSVSARAVCAAAFAASAAPAALADEAVAFAPAPWAGLVNELRSRDAHVQTQALRSLTVLANDEDNHKALISVGAVEALADALAACVDVEDVAKREPLLVNLLRALGDLSKKDGAHAACVEAKLPATLAKVLNTYSASMVAGAEIGWIQWMLNGIGLGGSGADAPAVQPPQQKAGGVSSPLASPDEAMIDFLNTSITSDTSAPMDLAAGIAYHAVRCVSNLSRNSSTHSALLDTDVLDPLLASINRARVDQLDTSSLASGDEQLTDMLRCTILAVSALSKSASETIVSKGGHRSLIRFMEQTTDPVAQTYAAGGVRNLARHSDQHPAKSWKIHRELVVSGVTEGLSSAMSASSNPQAQVFAVLAFGDIVSTGHHKARLIHKRLVGAYQQFADLLLSGNTAVARSVYRVLAQVYDDVNQESGKAHVPVPEALSTSIVEKSGMMLNGAAARGDLLAMRAVSSMCGDEVVAKGIVDKGALEVIVKGVTKGKGEYWEQCAIALARLSAYTKLVPFIASRGGLKAAILRPCPAEDGRWTAALLANMAREDEYRTEIAHSALPSLLGAARSKDESTRGEGTRGLYNLTLGGISRIMIGQKGALGPLVRAAALSTGDARRYAISALAGIAETYEYATVIVEADGLAVLLRAAEEDSTTRRDVARCLGHLSSVVEVHGSIAASGAAKWLMQAVSSGGGRGEGAAEVMHYATVAVCNIAYSAGVTRRVLRECGAIPVLTALSASGMNTRDVIQSAQQALINLRGNDKPGMLPVDSMVKLSAA